MDKPESTIHHEVVFVMNPTAWDPVKAKALDDIFAVIKNRVDNWVGYLPKNHREDYSEEIEFEIKVIYQHEDKF